VSTDERLKKAACVQHEFSNGCVECVRRYFLNRIESDYVPRWQYDNIQRELALERAKLASLKAELKYLSTP
jgi:hypothetical protein